MLKKILREIIGFVVERMPLRALDYLDRQFYARKLKGTLRTIQENGVAIRTVYDIGAHKGDWSRDFSRILPSSDFFLFEANASNEAFLKGTGRWYKIGVLSDQSRDVQFYGQGGTGDSYFKENTTAYSELTPTSMTSERLDDIVSEENLPFPDFIKIDTQGSEVDVLKGASNCLGNAKLVLVECPVYPYNEGAPQMGEYIEVMLGFGFYPAQVVEMHYLRGVFVQVDILFIERSVLELMDKDFSKFYLEL